jgi:2-aminoadipate transaminase
MPPSFIVQDDAFAELSLGPELPSSFWSIMQGEGAAILGTFSKTLAPGLRMGWVLSQQSVTEYEISNLP